MSDGFSPPTWDRIPILSVLVGQDWNPIPRWGLGGGYSFGKCGNTNAARTGGGIGESAPRTDRQITSLKIRSSMASSFEKSHVSASFAPHAVLRFTAFISTSGTTCLYVPTFGLAANALYIGVAAASNWLIGRNPRISSIVRSMLAVEYIVESTLPCCVYGLTTNA